VHGRGCSLGPEAPPQLTLRLCEILVTKFDGQLEQVLAPIVREYVLKTWSNQLESS